MKIRLKPDNLLRACELMVSKFHLPCHSISFLMQGRAVLDRAEGGEEVSIDQYYNADALSQ